VSFALVGAEMLEHARLADDAAARLALDVAIWDQRGCLSPQLCFVEGDFAAAHRFAERLAIHFDRLLEQLPPGRAAVDEDLAVRRFRDDAEWRRIGGEQAELLCRSDSLDWTIVVEPRPGFMPTPLRRSLRVYPVADFDCLRPLLQPARRHLAAAGMALPNERVHAMREPLAALGVHRLCAVGRMQRPTLEWTQDGRRTAGDWVSWSNDDCARSLE
jgi:hypothetical protein